MHLYSGPPTQFVSGVDTRAVLTHGKDEKVKAWAEQIIKAQEAEIAEMQAWLKERQ
jgi:uncharacterized protein (DUF305 family)